VESESDWVASESDWAESEADCVYVNQTGSGWDESDWLGRVRLVGK
jgi:hypothetical protein